MSSIDEDETHEVYRFDGTQVAVIHTGLDIAEARARGAYLAGRLLRKRASLTPHA